MQKPAKKSAHPKRSRKTTQRRTKPAVAPPSMAVRSKSVERTSQDTKQARVIAMLQAPSGATAAAIMQQTGWQPHSVRGFLAGVIRKKLKLTLHSTKLEGQRVYRIDADDRPAAATVSSPRRRAV